MAGLVDHAFDPRDRALNPPWSPTSVAVHLDEILVMFPETTERGLEKIPENW